MGNKLSTNHDHQGHKHHQQNIEQNKQIEQTQQQYQPPLTLPIEPQPIVSIVQSNKVPTLNTQSSLLNEESIKFLAKNMPSDDYRNRWELLFSSTANGHSFNRFCLHITDRGSTIVLVKDDGGNIFGGFAEESWKPKYPKFYGNAKNFVFRIHPTMDAYKAVGKDRNYQYLNEGTSTLYNGIAFGGVQYLYGWCIDDSFDYGHSKGVEDGNGNEFNSTYHSPPLSSHRDFKCVYVEVWKVRDRVLTEEEQLDLDFKQANKKKQVGAGGILREDNNADKVIMSLMGHEFSDQFHGDKKDKGK